MTTDNFNDKYFDYLEEGHYGLDIGYPSIVNYLDKVFEDLIKIPGFKYSQIKLKFHMARFYTNLRTLLPEIGGTLESSVERRIDELVKIEDEINKRLRNQ